MADLTIAVSEAVCAKTLEVVVANFGFDVSGGRPTSAPSSSATTAVSS